MCIVATFMELGLGNSSQNDLMLKLIFVLFYEK